MIKLAHRRFSLLSPLFFVLFFFGGGGRHPGAGWGGEEGLCLCVWMYCGQEVRFERKLSVPIQPLSVLLNPPQHTLSNIMLRVSFSPGRDRACRHC